jgi:uncharacterized repeat protein (TIGR03803 family)
VARRFCNTECGDGYEPHAGLFKDKLGNLWGTASTSASGFGDGTVFKIALDGTFSVMKSFDIANNAAPDGINPMDSLIQDKEGNLWGTTEDGGNSQPVTPGGTVFEIAPNGTFSTVYRFCSQANCADGGYPHTNLTLGKKGTIWGTTYGTPGLPSTVFQITP